MFVREDSPLLKYYDFGGDGYVSNVRHNGGGFAASYPTGTEVLALFDYPEDNRINLQPSIWAYKNDEANGRIVLTGSHPEEGTSGELLDLASAMILYALDGQGLTPLKGVLKSGRPLAMERPSEKIGDYQCHHYAFWVPEGAESVNIIVKQELESNLMLRLNKEGFAYAGCCNFESNTGSLSVKGLDPGLWYASVQCMTTVVAEDTEFGTVYTNRLEVLNGVPYSISLSIE